MWYPPCSSILRTTARNWESSSTTRIHSMGTPGLSRSTCSKKGCPQSPRPRETTTLTRICSVVLRLKRRVKNPPYGRRTTRNAVWEKTCGLDEARSDLVLSLPLLLFGLDRKPPELQPAQSNADDQPRRSLELNKRHHERRLLENWSGPRPRVVDEALHRLTAAKNGVLQLLTPVVGPAIWIR